MKIINFLTYIFKERSRLIEENTDLKAKLLLKQQHINKTNAYWKGQLRGLQQGSGRYS